MAAKSSSAKPDKAARAEAKKAKRAASRERRTRLFQAFNMQRKQDKALVPLMVGCVVVGAGVFFGVGAIWGAQWFALPLGVAFGVLGAVAVFGQRMQRSVYAQADGQPGAAGWVLDNMKGPWRVTQGVAGTTQLDAVHRVIGRPGIILVAEGAPHRANRLLAQEKKRTARLVGHIPIYDIVIGDEQGQVPLRKLQRHLTKLPRNITAQQMDVMEGRLAALNSRAAAMPKGPLPQGAKMRSVPRAVKRR
jgi:hypothetical protein